MTTQEEIRQLEEAIQRATAAKASLEEKLKKESKPEGNEFFAIPAEGERVHYLKQSVSSGRFVTGFRTVEEGEEWNPCPTSQYISAFAEALNIWKEWNACEGVEALREGVEQWVVQYLDPVSVQEVFTTDVKCSKMSPLFGTEEQALASVDKIGVHRIDGMRRLLKFDLTALSEED